MDLFIPLVRLADGWASDVLLRVDTRGVIESITPHARQGDANVITGPVIPGMPNTHSHAFQRLMAGLTEWRAQAHDSFWSWRELMYRYAGQLDPDQLHAAATLVYIEMLKAGYTSVCEFQYLHHDEDGSKYNPASRMSEVLISAARDCGIAMTLLPAWYLHGGFDHRPVRGAQRRYRQSLDDIQQLIADLKPRENHLLRIGGACHSLRAVPPRQVSEFSEFLEGLPTVSPFHIHIAEQQLEVQEAVQHLQQRPVEYLLDHVALNAHSCLVHATHITDDECERLARSPATVSLCPSTEANLGDGIFPLRDYLAYTGSLGIGTDSQVTISPVEELRWLEYGQRLSYQQRNVATSEAQPHCGDFLWNHAVHGGALASGHSSGGLQPGNAASFIVLDTDLIPANCEHPAQLLDALVFAGSNDWVRDVYVNGECVVSGGHHSHEYEARQNYHHAVARGGIQAT
ncbi:MAG: formimidoylglutamate deiminase [Gammaproteobacteria bacterium]|nr:formimidoylglutamate deiminase [Gammaproteobacteria bacterium]